MLIPVFVLPTFTRAETAYEVHAEFVGAFVQNLAVWNVALCFARTGYKGNRSNGNSLVDNRHTEFFFYVLTDLHQICGLFHHLVIDFLTGGLAVL